jgi:hypothetical protein
MNVTDIGGIQTEESTSDSSLRAGNENEGNGEGNGSIPSLGEDQETDNSQDFETPISEDDRIKFAEGIQQGLDMGFLAMNGFKLKKDYPKSFKDFLNWVNGRSQVGELDENFLIGSLTYSPRTILPEFFDEHKMYINFIFIEIGPTNWKYTITEPGIGVTASTDLYSSRVHAEVAAYYAAFKKLENQLT